jgi:hypothetical protein
VQPERLGKFKKFIHHNLLACITNLVKGHYIFSRGTTAKAEQETEATTDDPGMFSKSRHASRYINCSPEAIRI